MDLADLPLVVEPMQLAHLPAIMEIERESFPIPWPERAYRHDLTQNDLAYYYVLCHRLPSPAPERMSVWKRLWQMIRHRPAPDVRPILGYGGFWLMSDEAHISTLAVRAAWRRQGLGELLLIALLDEARRLGASQATLEVRVSNVTAQMLYAKYGFEQVGRRKGYYGDSGEDALIMTTPEFDTPAYRGLVNARQCDLLRRLSQIPLDKIPQMH